MGPWGPGFSLSRGMGILDLMQKQGSTTEPLVVQWASPDVKKFERLLLNDGSWMVLNDDC
jgi:hypothetical protein